MAGGTKRSALKATLLGIVPLPCLCVYAPFVFIVHRMRKSRPPHQIHEHREGHHGSYPAPLKLRSTESSLTLPELPDHVQHHKHTTSTQNQCLLITKLPVELRKLIWELCLGGNIFHLTIAHYRGEEQSRLVHIVCQEKSNHEGCFSIWRPFDLPDNDNGNMISPRPWQDSNFLSLVLTCRRIYSEAIDLLYASNTFDLSVYGLRTLPSLLLPQRLDAIRSLHLNWETIDGPPVPPTSKGYWEAFWNDWEYTWTLLAGMKSLSTLHVELKRNVFFSAQQWMEYEGEEKDMILQPVRAVTRPAVFHVQFPFHLPLEDPSLNTLPCSISCTSPYQ